MGRRVCTIVIACTIMCAGVLFLLRYPSRVPPGRLSGGGLGLKLDKLVLSDSSVHLVLTNDERFTVRTSEFCLLGMLASLELRSDKGVEWRVQPFPEDNLVHPPPSRTALYNITIPPATAVSVVLKCSLILGGSERERTATSTTVRYICVSKTPVVDTSLKHARYIAVRGAGIAHIEP
jgi:hypothetical protein